MKEASRQGMATLLNLISHKFHPQGVTALALLAESHISIHTWPENGYAAVDVFTCGQGDPRRACEFLVKQFQAQNHSLRILPRGEFKDSANNTHEMTTIKDEQLCPARN
jgi:S-adenosylmethionine decarboxylase